MTNVLVTGANGQLASCIKDLQGNFKEINFIYKNSRQLDISNRNVVLNFFQEKDIDFCINCAAYTAVDLAESNEETAEKVNFIGVQNLILGCIINDTKLIHVSTDFVYNGNKKTPYIESDFEDPIGVYGRTKLKGENALIKSKVKHFIVRTSWLYSEHGNNFMKTMLRLGKERSELSVVNDQIGTPTYAKDLAMMILKIIRADSIDYGIYQYSNEGMASWYDFANEIFKNEKLSVQLNGIPTSAYPTPAERPKYSVLNKSKIKEMLNIDIPHWKVSLKQAMKSYHKL